MAAAASPATAPSKTTAPTHPVPVEICGYTVHAPLGSTHACYLCIGPGGRGVVLKKMAEECIVNGLLHPSIRERLSRVRELAHAGIANLHGVGRDDSGAWMIWEFVEGRTLDEHLAAEQRTPRELAVLGRELAMTVESLHMQGIVHGAITAQNVLISPNSIVRLTHVSPMLFTEPAGDAQSVIEVLHHAIQKSGGHKARWPVARLIDQATEEDWPLRILAARLAALIESRTGKLPPTEAVHRDRDRRSKRRSFLSAFMVLLIGAAVAYGVWYTIGEPGKAQMRQWAEPVMEKVKGRFNAQ